MARLLAVLAVLSGLAGALSAALTDRTRQYSADAGRIVARDRGTGRVVWQRPAPDGRFTWLGQTSGVLIGAGVDAVYGLNARDGGNLWRHPLGGDLQKDSRVVRGLVLVSTGNGAYASTDTDVLDAKTGRGVLSTTGALAYQDQTQVVFECAFVPVPYCSGFNRTALDRVNLSTMKGEHWELYGPTFEGCSYIETGADHVSRFTMNYVDYLIEDSCGWVFVRYTWAGGPEQKPLIRRVPSRTWPKGL